VGKDISGPRKGSKKKLGKVEKYYYDRRKYRGLVQGISRDMGRG